MNTHICARCNKTLVSSQSLWKHRQRCKDATKDNLHGTSKIGFLKPRIDSIPDKEKLVADIINKEDLRANDRPTTSIVPRVNFVPKLHEIDSKPEKI